jgi:hypothetical protein
MPFRVCTAMPFRVCTAGHPWPCSCGVSCCFAWLRSTAHLGLKSRVGGHMGRATSANAWEGLKVGMFEFGPNHLKTLSPSTISPPALSLPPPQANCFPRSGEQRRTVSEGVLAARVQTCACPAPVCGCGQSSTLICCVANQPDTRVSHLVTTNHFFSFKILCWAVWAGLRSLGGSVIWQLDLRPGPKSPRSKIEAGVSKPASSHV